MLKGKHIPTNWNMQAKFHLIGKNMDFKSRLREWLEDEGIKPEALCKLIPFGKSQVYNYLNGKSEPTLSFFSAIGEEFPHLNLSWLLSGVGPRYKPQNNSSSQVINGGNGHIMIGGRMQGHIVTGPGGRAGGELQADQVNERAENWPAAEYVAISTVLEILEDYVSSQIMEKVKKRLRARRVK